MILPQKLKTKIRSWVLITNSGRFWNWENWLFSQPLSVNLILGRSICTFKDLFSNILNTLAEILIKRGMLVFISDLEQMLENQNVQYLDSIYTRKAFKTCASSFSCLYIKKSCRIWPLAGPSGSPHFPQNTPLSLKVCPHHDNCVQQRLILTDLTEVYRICSGCGFEVLLSFSLLYLHIFCEAARFLSNLKQNQICKDKFRHI